MKTTDFITEGIAEDADEMHRDHEVQMARADCYNAAKYAIELHKLLHKIAETQGLDGWVSEKITLANDYLRTVHEYLTHEMAQGQQDTVIIPEFSFESANAKFNRLVNEGVAEGVTSPEIKQAYKDIMNTAPHTPERKSAVRKYQKLRVDALDKQRKEQGVAEGLEESNHWYDAGVKDANSGAKPNPRTYLPTIKDKKAKHPEEISHYMDGYKSVANKPAEKSQGVAEESDKQFAQRMKKQAEQPPTKGMSQAEKVKKGWAHPDTLKKQGVAEGAEFGAYYYEQLAQQTFDINPNLQDENEILNLGYKIAKGELGSRAQGMFRDEDFPSDFVSAYAYLKKQGVNEVSDATLTSYLTKVDADSQKHEKDPTKRSAEKRNKSVAGFSRAFNKLDARKEKVDEIDPNNYDSDEDYYRDLEAQDQRNGATKRPYNPDWDADDEEFMQKWYEKHGLRESSVGGISAGAFATGPTAGGGKPGTGKPKKVGNMISRKKPQIGKGIY